MKDDRGLYYYPAPENKRIRMYVRKIFGAVEFRMHNLDLPEVWDRHGWVPYDEIQRAAALYKERGRAANPLLLYDLRIADQLLAEAGEASTH
ncbi:hypothetical protein JCM15519_30840 [Fundidesulfovibrio butyratiphilus]